ncbi:tryptophan synthase subunit alpha [Liquorilactobacillus vini]|uniref:Tryptophan synthase alpha chain n=1 Tax=Liquorilactobacillus vini DSM 20605 TaxID=1133569 RepID=A0A0R2CEQ7_9LACO|nr:tryptophan synthase subunit alpha [Liquorilactobacillus vini]KRM89570.1 tryptophan synthase [Liquorilactobacillus vini DSM 20605]
MTNNKPATTLTNAFKKSSKTFIGFLTAGDPTFEKSVKQILALAEAGTDIIEIGIPFSDPVADGPVIQAADLRAFAAEITTDKVFELVAAVRQKSQVPLAFLVYLNNVFKYGYEKFFKRCAKLQVGGLIIPDLPFEERAEVLPFAQKYGVALIPLVAPTSGQRIPSVVKDATGFVYAVSSMGVTGVRDQINTDLAKMVAEIHQATDVPVAIGFGIHTPQQAARVAQVADGVIVGSAIVKIIAQNKQQTLTELKKYATAMKKALSSRLNKSK